MMVVRDFFQKIIYGFIIVAGVRGLYGCATNEELIYQRELAAQEKACQEKESR